MARRRKNAPPIKKRSADEKRQRKMRTIMGVVLAFLMVISLAGIFLSPTNQGSGLNEFTYGEYSFVIKNLEGTNQFVYTIEINGEEQYFYTLPDEALSIDTQGNLSSLITPVSFVVLTANMSSEFAQIYDLMRFELDQSSKQLFIGGTIEQNVTDTYTRYTCLNGTTQMPVIEIIKSNSTSIEVSATCAKIYVEQETLALVRDRILYTTLGIINS